MQIRDRADIPMGGLAELRQRYHARELALFSSVLCDDFRDDSDIDTIGSDRNARPRAAPRRPRSVAPYSGE